MTIEPIAHIRSPFGEKFGIPRQSSLAECPSRIEFEQGYALEDAVRGLEAFSHIWLIWGFSEARWEGNFTVRPPRLGGNTRIGVFASRSPFRPNSLGMSAVRLQRIEFTADRGPVLHVVGADLLDGTPIYDIKPYIPYADCIPEASDGYTAGTKGHRLEVVFAPGVAPMSDSGVDALGENPAAAPMKDSSLAAHGEAPAAAPVKDSSLATHGEAPEAAPVKDSSLATHGEAPEAAPVRDSRVAAHGENHDAAISAEELEQITQLLALDPRVSYDHDPDKVWGMAYSRWNVRFTVAGDTATVIEIARR